MSLRLRLIGLIAGALALSLALGAAIACFNASRSVETEMRSAATVARQVIETSLARLGTAAHPQEDLEALVASFRGNRHLRVFLTGAGTAVAAPTVEIPAFGKVPGWFADLVGVAGETTLIPVSTPWRRRRRGGHRNRPAQRDSGDLEQLCRQRAHADFVFRPDDAAGVAVHRPRVAAARPPRRGAGRHRPGRLPHPSRWPRLPRELSRLRDSFNRMAGQLSDGDGGEPPPQRAAADLAGAGARRDRARSA